MFQRKSSTAVCAALASLSFLLINGAPPAVGQGIALPVNEADRDREFASLERDVADLNRQLSIYKRVAKLVAPSVVHLEATPSPNYSYRRDLEEAGSGVVVQWRNRRYVLTNRHVVRHSDKDRIRIELTDGRRLRPTEIWSDAESDVAVLAIREQDLLPARIGDSDKAEIGEFVMAFGSPFNLRQSVTRGIISAKGRSNLDLGDEGVLYQNFIQTDAAINPGNSGGPLVNLRAEVIGLNTAIASNSGGNEGIGFSIPINVAVQIMGQLIDTRGKTVEGGFLGVTIDGGFDARTARFVGLPRYMGARLKDVTQGGPADHAGLQSQDVIVRFDDIWIDDGDHLINLLSRTAVGRRAPVVVFRSGETVAVQVVVGRRSPAIEE